NSRIEKRYFLASNLKSRRGNKYLTAFYIQNAVGMAVLMRCDLPLEMEDLRTKSSMSGIHY
ncbi:MAG: hypothetical protein WD555_03220, partial [Fulvivirga sp.]